MRQHPRNSRIRVVCVDDNRLLAEAVERRLNMDGGFEWAGWLARTETLLEDVARLKPDVLLLDIDMPGRDPLDLLQDLAANVPETRVVMFSGYVRREYVDRAIEAGAWGYISKNASIEEVLAAIEQVASGEFVLTSEVLAEHRRSTEY
jgi:DNA-binding NarL/FixJ family response regulator